MGLLWRTRHNLLRARVCYAILDSVALAMHGAWLSQEKVRLLAMNETDVQVARAQVLLERAAALLRRHDALVQASERAYADRMSWLRAMLRERPYDTRAHEEMLRLCHTGTRQATRQAERGNRIWRLHQRLSKAAYFGKPLGLPLP